MTDIVATAIANYEWPQVEPWVVSLKRSGFKGEIHVILYEGSFDLYDKLVEQGVKLHTFGQDPVTRRYTYTGKPYSIVVDRFLHIYQFLKNRNDLGNIIYTDAKDVIFQSNPIPMLKKKLDDDEGLQSIVVGREELLYKDEPWGKDNMERSFPFYAPDMMNTNICCAGVLSGIGHEFLRFCMNIYHMCFAGFAVGCHNPDQAAMNVLITLTNWRYATYRVGQEEPFVAHLGTTGDPSKIEAFKPNLKCKLPILDINNGQVLTNDGKKFAIVHQYDRVPGLKEKIMEIYREKV